MSMVYTSKFREPKPFQHQLVGVDALLRNKAFFLADAPRTCKSRQVVDAACILKSENKIDLVVVICPVAARAVWGDRNLGQVKLYSWLPARVIEFHAKQRELWADAGHKLTWVVTNFDFIRNEVHLEEMLARLQNYRSIFLVVDESSAIGDYKSQQTKAVQRIRNVCSRVVMLNGTPGDPAKLWSQFNVLNNVLSRRYKSFTTFKWSYAQWGKAKEIPAKGRTVRVVHPQVGWKNLEQLSSILSPYCLRRERKDCPELRDIPIQYDLREVRLQPKTWTNYQQLKREAIIELSKDEVYLSLNAAVRLMRLAQITSGHLGGFEEGEPTRNLSSEKLDWLVRYLQEWSTADNFIVWCRWIRERERLAVMLDEAGFEVHQIYGGQKRNERREAEMVFANGVLSTNGKRRAMIAQPQAGGIALDFSSASEVFRMSSDYNLKTLEQSDDRPLGPAQKAHTVIYTDVLATGPEGQRTIDHIIVAALRKKKNLAKMTMSQWKKELEEE